MQDLSHPWIIGIDPGRVNGGVCFFNRFTHEARLLLIDFMRRLNPRTGKIEKAEYEEKHVFERVQGLVNDFANVFGAAHLVLVEKQMRREHLIFAAALVGYLRGRFPATTTISVTQHAVRTFFKNSDEEYEIRKGLSADVVEPFLGPAAAAECRIKFYKGDAADTGIPFRGGKKTAKASRPKKGPGHVDPQEACLISLYGFYEEAKAIADDARPMTFSKKQDKPQPPVRAVYIPHLDLDAGMADVNRRKFSSSSKKRKRGDDDDDDENFVAKKKAKTKSKSKSKKRVSKTKSKTETKTKSKKVPTKNSSSSKKRKRGEDEAESEKISSRISAMIIAGLGHTKR